MFQVSCYWRIQVLNSWSLMLGIGYGNFSDRQAAYGSNGFVRYIS